ncbi:MAG: fimbrillin family protein [Bacteroidales bacterium]|nr:fimbrillin family protein [Bacteroidales bacterium]
MKRYSIYIFTTAFALASCSGGDDEPKSQVATSPQILIGTGSSSIGWSAVATSRVEHPDISTVMPTTMGVWGYISGTTVFENQKMFYLDSLKDGDPITKAEWDNYSPNKWPYKPTKEWGPSTAYQFAAYAPYLDPSGERKAELLNSEGDAAAMGTISQLRWSHIPRSGATDYMFGTSIVNYTSKATTGNPEQQVTLRHIGTRLRFNFLMGEEFLELRRLHLKEVSIETPNGALYTVTVNYDSDGNASTPIWEAETTTKDNTWENLIHETNTDDGYLWLTNSYQPFGSCYVYPGQSMETLNVKVTYDVYDLSTLSDFESGKSDIPGQLLRENDTATNVVWLKLIDNTQVGDRVLEAGKYFDVMIRIEPAFIYVLSDNDPTADGYIIIE